MRRRPRCPRLARRAAREGCWWWQGHRALLNGGSARRSGQVAGPIVHQIQLVNCNWLILIYLLLITLLRSPHCIPLTERDSTGLFRTLANVTFGTVGPDRMATTERTAIPNSPQAAGQRSLRRESVHEAFRGVPACQGPGNLSLPGKARGLRGQDTVEGYGGFDVVMERAVQWEQENPASNDHEMIDDFRLRGSRTWRRMGGHLTKGR